MSNSRLIYISNDDKNVSESKSNSDFIVYLKENVSVQASNYIVIKNICIPNFFYNVRSGAYGSFLQNDTFVFQELSPLATFAVVVPQGQYLISDYIVALENAMNAVLVSGTVAITIDPITQKLRFTCTGTSISVFSRDNGNTAYALVGAFENFNTPNFATQPMPFLPDFSGVQNVYIESKELASSHGNDPSFGLINILGQINLSNTEFGQYAFFETNDTELGIVNYPDARNIQRVDIRLVDGQGNTLPIGNGRVSLTVKYHYD